MIATTSVYWLIGGLGDVQYVGLTRNLRSRLSGRTVPMIGVRYFPSREQAKVFECVEIARLRPPANGTDYSAEKTVQTEVSGRPPNFERAMTAKEKRPPWYYVQAEIAGLFDAVFVYDEQCHKAGFDASRRKPFRPPSMESGTIKPHWVKMLARKYTGDAKRTAPDVWDGILLDADGRPVHTRGAG